MKILPRLCAGGVGKPELESTNEREGAIRFAKLPWSDWPEANLVHVLKYLRGSKHLNPPDYWKAVFPKPFEILHKIQEEAKARPMWA